MTCDTKFRSYADGVRKALWKNHRIEKTTDQLSKGWLVRIRIEDFLRERIPYATAAARLTQPGNR